VREFHPMKHEILQVTKKAGNRAQPLRGLYIALSPGGGAGKGWLRLKRGVVSLPVCGWPWGSGQTARQQWAGDLQRGRLHESSHGCWMPEKTTMGRNCWNR
jgi:hypothetical protein